MIGTMKKNGKNMKVKLPDLDNGRIWAAGGGSVWDRKEGNRAKNKKRERSPHARAHCSSITLMCLIWLKYSDRERERVLALALLFDITLCSVPDPDMMVYVSPSSPV